MLKFPRDGITNASEQIADLKTKGHQLAYVGDVVGTGSSRKSATNSILWYMGQDIPCAPNKRTGGFVIGGVIAPIFFNTMEDPSKTSNPKPRNPKPQNPETLKP